MKNKKYTKITAALNAMSKDDIYSMMLFILYKLKESPDCLALSELCYIINNDSLNKFLRYYGGMTITIPTLEELKTVLQALYLYEYVNIDGGDFKDGLKVVSGDMYNPETIKEIYVKVVEVMSDYEFKRDSD